MRIHIEDVMKSTSVDDGVAVEDDLSSRVRHAMVNLESFLFQVKAFDLRCELGDGCIMFIHDWL